MKQDLFSNLKLRRNGSNASVGGRTLIPCEGNLKEAVKPRKGERNSLLLLRDTILGAQSSTGSYIRLSGTSGLSAFLRKTAFKLIFIGDSYSDTSVCPPRGD
jgi:hypothetical protein